MIEAVGLVAEATTREIFEPAALAMLWLMFGIGIAILINEMGKR